MTPEQRLDRLERIARLLVTAGLREREQLRERNEKIKMILDAQIKNDERFAKLAEARAKLAASRKRTTRRFDEWIDIIREQRNDKT